MENLVRAIIEARDGSLWFGTYPYARGAGGISVARYQATKSLHRPRPGPAARTSPAAKRTAPGGRLGFRF